MRGIYTSVIDIRRKVFTEVARLAYEGGDYAKKIEQLPFKILPGELASYRESIFLERAIIGERLRLAIGLPVRTAAESAPVSDGIEESAIARKYYDPPLINIIKFACHACPENKVLTTNGCQGCLAHPCTPQLFQIPVRHRLSGDAHYGVHGDLRRVGAEYRYKWRYDGCYLGMCRLHGAPCFRAL